MESTRSPTASSDVPATPEPPDFDLASVIDASDPPELAPDQALDQAIDEATGPFEGDAPTIDEPHLLIHPETSVWQRPFTQKVLPVMTSVLLHLGVFLIFYLTYKVVVVFHQKEEEQFIIPDAAITEGTEGGIPHPGNTGDSSRDQAQDKFPDVPLNAHGSGENEIIDEQRKNSGGDAQIAAGTKALAGAGRFLLNSGFENEGGAPRFGFPGGGDGVGSKSSFAGTSGNARRIVFVLDATGSMMSEFDNLRTELRHTVDALKPPQEFNVVFIQEDAPPPPAPNLLFVTPENKKLVEDYVDKFTPRGPTDPLPALKTAFAMHPQLVYFLVDPSDFPDKKAVIDLVRKQAVAGKIKMNVSPFSGDDVEGEKFLKQLADETGGNYHKVRSGAELGKLHMGN